MGSVCLGTCHTIELQALSDCMSVFLFHRTFTKLKNNIFHKLCPFPEIVLLSSADFAEPMLNCVACLPRLNSFLPALITSVNENARCTSMCAYTPLADLPFGTNESFRLASRSNREHLRGEFVWNGPCSDSLRFPLRGVYSRRQLVPSTPRSDDGVPEDTNVCLREAKLSLQLTRFVAER